MLSGEVGRGENIMRQNSPKFPAAKLLTAKFPVAKFKTTKISQAQIFWQKTIAAKIPVTKICVEI